MIEGPRSGSLTLTNGSGSRWHGSGTLLLDVAIRKTVMGRTYVRNDDGGSEDGQLSIVLQREHDRARGDPLPRLLSARVGQKKGSATKRRILQRLRHKTVFA